jgi:hypothetical protein
MRLLSAIHWSYWRLCVRFDSRIQGTIRYVSSRAYIRTADHGLFILEQYTGYDSPSKW